MSLVQHVVLLHLSAKPTCQFSIFDSDIGTNKFLKLIKSQCELNIHRGSNLFDKRFFPVKYWIVIAYAVSCCLLPKQTPYDL